MTHVFEPAELGPIAVKNRIVRSATHEGLGDIEGYPSEGLVAMYDRLAKGGVGTLVTGYVGVSKAGRTGATMRLFHEDALVDVYRPIVDQVKSYGTAIVQQIAHGGALAGLGLPEVELVAPSEYKVMGTGTVARALRPEEIEVIIEDFVAAIVRTQAAGFDGVQLHAAHIYLLTQFLSPHVNRRTDEWGGSGENRFRILKEIITRARERVGHYPIFAKYSAYSYDKNGITEEEGIRIAERFEAAGYDGIEISCGGFTDLFSSMRVPKIPLDPAFAYIPELKEMSGLKRFFMRRLFSLGTKAHKPLRNFNLDIAARIKQRVSIPVVVVGGIRTLADIEAIIDQGKADFVSMCRPFIRAPNLVDRMMSQKQTESRCIDCGYCLFYSIDHPVRCLNGKVL